MSSSLPEWHLLLRHCDLMRGDDAEKLDVSHEEAAQAIAEALPQVVDRVSPDGQLPPEQDLDQAFERLAQAAPTPAS
jgi:YidB-like protein